MDGELSKNEEKKFREHLEICTDCQKELETLVHGDRLLSNLSEIEPSKDFDRNFWERIDVMEPKKTGWSIPWDIIFGKIRPQFALTFSVILIAGIIFFERAPFKPSEDEILIAENLELFQNYEMINHLDLLENWEAFTEKKENT